MTAVTETHGLFNEFQKDGQRWVICACRERFSGETKDEAMEGLRAHRDHETRPWWHLEREELEARRVARGEK